VSSKLACLGGMVLGLLIAGVIALVLHNPWRTIVVKSPKMTTPERVVEIHVHGDRPVRFFVEHYVESAGIRHHVGDLSAAWIELTDWGARVTFPEGIRATYASDASVVYAVWDYHGPSQVYFERFTYGHGQGDSETHRIDWNE